MHVEIRAERKAVRSHKPIFWIQMQIVEGWWIFTSSSESLPIVFITGAFAILILGQKKRQKSHSSTFLWAVGSSGFVKMGNDPRGEAWLGRSGVNPDPALTPLLNQTPFLPTLSSTTVGKIKQSSACSQDKVAQVSSELQKSNKLIFPLRRRQMHPAWCSWPALSLLPGLL